MTNPLILNTPHVIHEQFDDEVIVIHMLTGVYYALQGSADFAWAYLKHGVSLEDLTPPFAKAHGISEGQAHTDLAAFIEQTTNEELVRPAQDGEVAPIDEAPTATTPYSPPVLSRYDDLQDLLLLDPIHEIDPDEGWPNTPHTSD